MTSWLREPCPHSAGRTVQSSFWPLFRSWLSFEAVRRPVEGWPLSCPASNPVLPLWWRALPSRQAFNASGGWDTVVEHALMAVAFHLGRRTPGRGRTGRRPVSALSCKGSLRGSGTTWGSIPAHSFRPPGVGWDGYLSRRGPWAFSPLYGVGRDGSPLMAIRRSRPLPLGVGLSLIHI